MQFNKKNNKHKCDYLIFDMTNILYRSFFANKNEDDNTIAGLAHHMALMTLNKYFKLFRPSEKIIMCFDRPSWRKDYTKSDECVSGKLYKGNRRKDMSPAQKAKFQAFLEHITEFEEMMREHTSSVILSADKLEADDLVAGSIETLVSLNPKSRITVISSDKDFIQCLRHDVVSLVDPSTGKLRTLDDWDGDADLFMYEKCIRGDAGDNVHSAYPRCRKTKIHQAYHDPLAHTNLMHEEWTGIDGESNIVKHRFKENQLLMDLTKQPDDIYQLIIETIMFGLSNTGEFSHFHFMKFLGKYEMKKISENVGQFINMLSK